MSLRALLISTEKKSTSWHNQHSRCTACRLRECGEIGLFSAYRCLHLVPLHSGSTKHECADYRAFQKSATFSAALTMPQCLCSAAKNVQAHYSSVDFAPVVFTHCCTIRLTSDQPQSLLTIGKKKETEMAR